MDFCFNGQFVEETTPLFLGTERGVLVGDGVYDSMRIFQGVPVDPHKHWERLQASLQILGFHCGFSKEVIFAWIEALIQKNQVIEGYLRVTVTRGARTSPGLQKTAEGIPNVLIEARPLAFSPALTWTLGLAVCRRSSSSQVTCHKTTNTMENIIALEQARQRGFDEALFCVEHDYVQEGSRSNCFMVKGTSLWTPPCALALLPGVTRQGILDLYTEVGEVHEKPFVWNALLEADEIFMTNALWGVIPVTRFEGKEFSAFPITQAIQQSYWNGVKQQLLPSSFLDTKAQTLDLFPK